MVLLRVYMYRFYSYIILLKYKSSFYQHFAPVFKETCRRNMYFKISPGRGLNIPEYNAVTTHANFKVSELATRKGTKICKTQHKQYGTVTSATLKHILHILLESCSFLTGWHIGREGTR